VQTLLTPELLRRLEQFQLLARRRAKSSLKGERRSKARGQSVEFADYRNYVAGDDFRYLDWNLYGRLDRLFLKLYEEERELPVTVFLDASESMTFGEPRKFDFARQVAAAAGYVALCGFDRVNTEACAFTLDGGLNWTVHDFTDSGLGTAPLVSYDHRHFYIIYAALDNNLKMYASHDQGQTWTGPTTIVAGNAFESTIAGPLSCTSAPACCCRCTGQD